jgi:hypothetical protein
VVFLRAELEPCELRCEHAACADVAHFSVLDQLVQRGGRCTGCLDGRGRRGLG